MQTDKDYEVDPSSEAEEESSVRKRVEIVAQWSAASSKVFEFQEKLEQAKKLRDLLEKEHPWLSQVKGMVRGGTRVKKNPKVPRAEKSDLSKKKEVSAKEHKRKPEDPPGTTQKTVKARIEDRLKDQELRNRISRDHDFYPTTREVSTKDVSGKM